VGGVTAGRPPAPRRSGGDRRSGGAAGRRPGPARPAPRREADPARRVAYDLLRAVDERDAYANLTLPGLLRERGLTGRDAAFATELGYGTLRAAGTLDEILARAADRPIGKVDTAARAALRLGAYQLLRTRVPPHAAVSATVDLAPRRAAGFVNAVLRRVARQDWAAWVTELAPADPLGALALVHAHPLWIAAAFRDALGGSMAETRAALEADDARPQTHLVARPGRVDRDLLAEQAGGEPGPWSPYAVRLPAGGDPGALAAVRDGRAGVQDEGSQLCALALAAVPLDGPDHRWLDLCAGPGGKAALLGAVAALRPTPPGPTAPQAAGAPDTDPAGIDLAGSDPAGSDPAGTDPADEPGSAAGAVAGDRTAGSVGARVVAVELAEHRARLIHAAVRDLPVDVVQADGTEPPWDRGWADRVLVDAPCTGLGALRRRPEARWRRTEKDLAELGPTQRALLRQGIEAARPGGVIAYVVCSPHLAETRDVVADVLADGCADLLDASPYFPGDQGETAQLWPHRHGTDAMFCALLRRR
jgi:16S rRNA (cytosine967-C5)-methyltransferase